MPGPTTEVLNEDIKELKADLREVRGGVAVLGADVHRIDLGLGELRAEFRFAKWLVGILLAMTISGIGGGIWQAATLTANVRNLEVRSEERSKALDARLDDRFKALEARSDDRFKALEARLDKLEASIAKVIEQTRPKP